MLSSAVRTYPPWKWRFLKLECAWTLGALPLTARSADISYVMIALNIWVLYCTCFLRVSYTRLLYIFQLYLPVPSSWRYPLLCIGLADLIGISAASVCVVSLFLLCTSLSYAVWRFDHMQRATLELALASEAIYSQVQFAWNSMITRWRVKTVSVRVNPNRQTKLSGLLKHVESLTFAYKCNGLIAGLNMFETCRVLPFETRLLKLDPFALCDAGASTRKLVAYFSDLRKICRCLSKHRGDATRCAIVATWPQRKLNMTVGTRLGWYFEISAYKMLQDVTRWYKML